MRHLDTDTVIHLLRGSADAAERLKAALPAVGISALVLAELTYGALASQHRVEYLRRLDHFLPSVDVVPFDRAAAQAYANIRLSLRHRGRPIGDIDTLIAAVAVAAKATLVTHNSKHFQQVEGLILEDWLL